MFGAAVGAGVLADVGAERLLQVGKPLGQLTFVPNDLSLGELIRFWLERLR
jgi:hypothetical protein